MTPPAPTARFAGPTGLSDPGPVLAAMSVSLYYNASRAEPLTEAEMVSTERIGAAHLASFPYDDEESLCLYRMDDGDPGELLAGSTRMPRNPGRLMPVTAHVLDSLTELRRVLGAAQWRVHMDDLDVPWDETEGYALPGMRDPDLIAELGSL